MPQRQLALQAIMLQRSRALCAGAWKAPREHHRVQPPQPPQPKNHKVKPPPRHHHKRHSKRHSKKPAQYIFTDYDKQQRMCCTKQRRHAILDFLAKPCGCARDSEMEGTQRMSSRCVRRRSMALSMMVDFHHSRTMAAACQPQRDRLGTKRSNSCVVDMPHKPQKDRREPISTKATCQCRVLAACKISPPRRGTSRRHERVASRLRQMRLASWPYAPIHPTQRKRASYSRRLPTATIQTATSTWDFSRRRRTKQHAL
mmetsp:Transcript_11623/g.29359  ORF Transcript_11623/g.29359 Transcript_11623/m.29359 type:complete len:257 (-) Transcript_11623:665-1435(-)